MGQDEMSGVSAEMKEALEALGFVEHGSEVMAGTFMHPANHEVDPAYCDFTACSIRGAIFVALQEAFAAGADTARSEMRAALGIE